jgi:hypothetical protein
MRWRIVVLFAAVTAVVFGVATPAVAKGADQATITGPGLSKPIVLGGNGEPGSGEQLGKMSEDSGLFRFIFGADNGSGKVLLAQPAGDLGPKFSLNYRIPDAEPQGTTFHQDLYPSAAGGPVTFTPNGQIVFGTTVTGGWYQPTPLFAQLLTAIGVPGVATSATSTPSAPATQAATSARSDGAPGWLPGVIIGVAVGLAVLAVVGLGLRSRRRAAAT